MYSLDEYKTMTPPTQEHCEKCGCELSHRDIEVCKDCIKEEQADRNQEN